VEDSLAAPQINKQPKQEQQVVSHEKKRKRSQKITEGEFVDPQSNLLICIKN
jgi:hypothetical protein